MIKNIARISYGGAVNQRAAAFVLLVGWCGCATQSTGSAPRPGRPAAPGDAPSLFASPWTWTDEQGASIRFDQWRGAPIVVTMVFTGCTSTCPLTIEKLRHVTETFEREGRAATFVLVTLDPSNDTPEQLRMFKSARQLPGRWHLLRGNDADTRALADILQIHVLDDAHIFHDSRIVLFDRDGKLAGQLRG